MWGSSLKQAQHDPMLSIDRGHYKSYTLQDFEISGTGTYDPATAVITLQYSITDTSLACATELGLMKLNAVEDTIIESRSISLFMIFTNLGSVIA